MWCSLKFYNWDKEPVPGKCNWRTVRQQWIKHGSGNYQQYSKQAYIASQKIYWKVVSTDFFDNNFVSSDVNNCINNIRRSEKRNAKKTSQQSQQITKRLLIVGDSIIKNIEPYKMKKSTK